MLKKKKKKKKSDVARVRFLGADHRKIGVWGRVRMKTNLIFLFLGEFRVKYIVNVYNKSHLFFFQ